MRAGIRVACAASLGGIGGLSLWTMHAEVLVLTALPRPQLWLVGASVSTAAMGSGVMP
jgi:hypothetical protein